MTERPLVEQSKSGYPSISWSLWGFAKGAQPRRPCRFFHAWRRVWDLANGPSFLKCENCGAEWFPMTEDKR